MTVERQTLIPPVLLIAVGVGWLLTELDIAPRIEWVWTLGLGAVGLLAFVVGGWDKVTIVVGPFFILASGLSILRQTGDLKPDVEVPTLVIAAGVLLLVARSPAIPVPKFILEEPKRREPHRGRSEDRK
jgi:hypothetical protein